MFCLITPYVYTSLPHYDRYIPDRKWAGPYRTPASCKHRLIHGFRTGILVVVSIHILRIVFV